MTLQVYVVSDLAKGYDKLQTPYWRPTGMFSSLVFAKRWAFPGTSIITEHEFEEASEIMKTKTMPTTYKIVV